MSHSLDTPCWGPLWRSFARHQLRIAAVCSARRPNATRHVVRRPFTISPTATVQPLSSVDVAEVAKFGALASQWWRADGAFAGLHRMNAVRVPLIRRALLETRPATGNAVTAPLSGFSVLDVGCGGGILSEALARLGAQVTGIDASQSNVTAATQHAALDEDLAARLDYRCTTVEALAYEAVPRPLFDAVVCSEVIEHVSNIDTFLTSSAELVRPGGAFIATTINRSVMSFGLAILAAEYVLRIVPAGTHEWVRFVTPLELASALRSRGLRTVAETGLFYNPLTSTWSFSRDTAVNFALVAVRPEAAADTLENKHQF